MILSAAGTPGTTADFQFRLLTGADAEAAYRVHRRVFSALINKNFMYEHDLQFFVDLIQSKGRMIGAFFDESLVGYIGFRYAGLSENRHWRLLKHLQIKQESMAEGAGGAVLPEFRQRGIYGQLLQQRNEEAKTSGAMFQSTVVASDNTSSLKPVLNAGFLVSGVFEDETGINYLFVKPLWNAVHASGDGITISLHDVSENVRRLSKKHVGLPRLGGDTLEVRYYSPENICIFSSQCTLDCLATVPVFP
jgi:predicted N-acetyltransferase YhbS